MANPTMVIRITGNVDDLKKVLGDAEVAVETTTKAAESNNLTFGKLAASYVTAEAAIGLVTSGYQAYVGFLTDSIQSYINAEQAQARLTGALRANGTATPELIAQYGDLAAQFQQTTVFSGDLLTEMQALLTQVGDVAPGKMQAALRASTDLASGLGIDLKVATTAVAKALDGNVDSLQRYGIQIDDAALRTKGADAIFEAIQERFGGQAQAQLETFGGQLEQLANKWDDFKGQVGKVIAQDDQLQGVLGAANRLLDQMAGESDGAVTAVDALWLAWNAYIEIGRESVPVSREIVDVIGLMTSEVEDNTVAVNEAEEAWKRYLQHITDKGLKLPSLTDNWREYTRVQDELTASTKERITENQKLKDAEDRLFGRDLIERANTLLTALGDIGNLTKLTEAKKKELKTAIDAALAAYKALGEQAPPMMQAISDATTPVLVSTTRLASNFVPLKAAVEDSSEAIDEAVAALQVYDSGAVFTSSVIETELVPAVDALTTKMNESVRAALSWSDAMDEVRRGLGTMTGSAPMLPLEDFEARYWELHATLLRLGYTPGEAAKRLEEMRRTITAAAPTPRAMGGPVSAGMPYWVGEERPELFVPDQSGTIISNAVGGTTVAVNVHVGAALSSKQEIGRYVEDGVISLLRSRGVTLSSVR